jgi:hypothetical protein
MDSVQPDPQRETEQRSLDHVWQAGTPHRGPLNIMTIDPKLLQNVPAEEPAISPFQSVLLPVPNQSDPILPQALALGSPYQWDATALVRVNGSGPDNTSAHVLDNEPRQSKQGTRQKFTNIDERERNANATVQNVFPASRPYSSGQTSQFMVTPLAPNVTSSGIPTTNPQLESDLLRSQSQWEFQGITNAFNTTRHSAQKWESVRDTVVRLYSDNSLSLSKVMEIMEREHGFKARSVTLLKPRLL